MGAIGPRGWSGRMREISLFVTFFSFFFSFLHFACRSPRLTDFDDLYVKMRGSAQGSAYWVSRWQPEMFRGRNPPKTPFFGRNRHFKPNFRKLKSQYLRKCKSDRRKILNIASGRQVDFVDTPKIKSNQIQDGGGRQFWKTENCNNSAAVWDFVTKFGQMTDMDSPQRAMTSLLTLTKSKMADGRHFEKRKMS